MVTKSNPQTVLKPQDLFMLLRLALSETVPSYAALSKELGLTASEVHAGLARAVQAQLAIKDVDGKPRVLREPLRLFLQHGARYAFPATRAGTTRGWPTGYAAEPLRSSIVQPDEAPPVWPDKHGPTRGMTLYPLYPSAAQAAAQNPALYQLLALFDAVRAGSARERSLAVALLDERLA